MTRTHWLAAPIALVVTLLLAGCGSASSATAGDPTSGSTAGAPFSGSSFDPAQLLKIRQCLKTAGLVHTVFSTPAPGDGMSGSPVGKPTGVPSSEPGGPRFTPGGIFSDPQVVRALRVCQIELPGFAPSGGTRPLG